LQKTPSEVNVRMLRDKLSFNIETNMQVKGVAACSTHITVWDGTKVSTYEIGSELPSNHQITGNDINSEN